MLEHFVSVYELTGEEEFLEYAKRTADVLVGRLPVIRRKTPLDECMESSDAGSSKKFYWFLCRIGRRFIFPFETLQCLREQTIYGHF